MAKRYLVVTFDGDEASVRAAVQAGLDELDAKAGEACAGAVMKAIANARDPQNLGPVVTKALSKLAIEFAATCNSHEPLVSDQADPAIADRIAAIDLLVQGHPDCKPGRTMAEHAAAVLARHAAQNKTIADHSSVLQSVSPAALASAQKTADARKAKNAALLAEADAQRKAHADATQALAAKLKVR